MSGAERQARQREKMKDELDGARTLRAALSKIADRTCERLRTKAELEEAIDAIGIIASEALVRT